MAVIKKLKAKERRKESKKKKKLVFYGKRKSIEYFMRIYKNSDVNFVYFFLLFYFEQFYLMELHVKCNAKVSFNIMSIKFNYFKYCKTRVGAIVTTTTTTNTKKICVKHVQLQ